MEEGHVLQAASWCTNLGGGLEVHVAVRGGVVVRDVEFPSRRKELAEISGCRWYRVIVVGIRLEGRDLIVELIVVLVRILIQRGDCRCVGLDRRSWTVVVRDRCEM